MEEISNLKSNSTKVNVEATVEEIGKPREVSLKTGEKKSVAAVKIKDGSGTISLNLWDQQIKQVQKGSKIVVENGYVTSYKGTNSLNVGKFGVLRVLNY